MASQHMFLLILLTSRLSLRAVGAGDDQTATYVPAITVSRPISVASSNVAHIRSCWSPETCPSEETAESEYSSHDGNSSPRTPASPQALQHMRGDVRVYDEDDQRQSAEDEEDTIHARPPPIRKISGAFQRAPRADNIYQR